MSKALKGLLKGLRCVCEFFDNEKEQEFQIGAPTDVKHVAHIGCDGPSNTQPSWMSQFPSNSEPAPGSPNSTRSAPAYTTSGHDPLNFSPTRRGKTRQSRRQTANSSATSPVTDSSGIAKPRRIRNSILTNDSPSSSQEQLKKSRKKKGPGDGPTRPSRPKNRDLSTSSTTDI